MISGCSKEVVSPKEEVAIKSEAKISDIAAKIENQSPDKTVKSRWLIAEQTREVEIADCMARRDEYLNRAKERYQLLVKVTDGVVLQSKEPYLNECQEDMYSKEITEVKQETDTRAIVFAKIKNITPIPAKAVPDEGDLKRRGEGSDLKYVLEKMSDGWKVTQIYRYSDTNAYIDKPLWGELYDAANTPQVPQFAFVD